MSAGTIVQILSVAIFAVLCAAFHLILKSAFGIAYLDWYLASGSALGIGLAILGTVNGDLDRDHDLISSHPLLFFAGYAFLFAALIMTLADQVLSRGNRKSVMVFDTVASTVFAIVAFAGTVCWLVFVIPAQYFVVLIAGAPARLALASTVRVYIVERPSESGTLHRDFAKRSGEQQPPENYLYEPTLRRKPVTLTAALSGLLLLVVERAI